MMDDVFYWLGLLHAVAYATVAFITAITFSSALFINWVAHRWKLKRDILRAYQRVLEERRAAKIDAGEST